MYRSILSALALASLALSPSIAAAASKKEKKLMESITNCAYVMEIAEANGARYNYQARQVVEMREQFSQMLGLASGPYIEKARAKANKRARVMGADNALRDIMSRAKKCDDMLMKEFASQ